MLMISVCCLEGADRWIEQETRYLLPPQRRNAPAKQTHLNRCSTIADGCLVRNNCRSSLKCASLKEINSCMVTVCVCIVYLAANAKSQDTRLS